jgi:signal transduction histidine kinase
MGKIIENKFLKNYGNFSVLVIAIIAVLIFTSLYNYLLFHTLAEFFSVAVAFSVFLIAWNCRKFTTDNYLIVIGVSCFYVAILDLIHTLSYKGIGVIDNSHSDIPTQIWIASRYMQSLLFFSAVFFIKRKINPWMLLTAVAAVSGALLLSVFYWKNFPTCFVEGVGLTNFKIISEYLISLIFLLAIAALWVKRDSLPQSVVYPMVGALFLFILSELCFTLYISSYGHMNLIGHLFKVLGFALIYAALVKSYVTNPFETMFRDLKQRGRIQAKALSAARLRTNEVSSLLEVTKSIIKNDDFEQVVLDIITNCRKQASALTGYIFISDSRLAGPERFKYSACKGMKPFNGDNAAIEFLESRYGDIGLLEEPFYENDINENAGINEIRNLALAPVLVGNEYAGFIALFNKETNFVGNDLRMLISFAESASIAFSSFRSEVMLKESEERFTLFMDNFPALAYIKDKNGRYIYANRYFRDNLLSQDPSTGELMIEGLSEEEKETIRQEDAEIIGGKPLLESTKKMLGTQKEARHYLTRKFPLISRSGEKMIGGVTFDVTEKIRYSQDLLKEQQKLKNILDTMINGVNIVDADNNIRYVNPAMEKIFGKVDGKKCYEYICKKDEPCDWCNFDEVVEGKFARWEYHDENTGKVYECLEVPYSDTISGEIWKLKMIWDITDIRAADEKIKSLSLFTSENPSPVLRVSRDGVLLYANEAARELVDYFGLKEGFKVSQEIYSYVLAAFEKGKPINENIEINSHFSVLSIAPFASENYVNIYGRDITDFKAAEAGLIRAKSELEFRVRQRTKQLEKTVEMMETEVSERLVAESRLMANQKRLRLLTQELILTEERERRKFAVQLHDSIGQLLAYSKRELGVLVDSVADEQKPKVRKVWDIIGESIGLTRKVTFDLSSPTLYTLGLKTAIEEVAEQVGSQYRQRCRLRRCTLPDTMAEDVEVFLFRSIRELILNAAKHSNASDIYIDIDTDGGLIEVVVADDGVGFNTEELNNHSDNLSSYGLFSVRENIGNLGGSLDVKSQPGKGTHIFMRVPYKESNSEYQDITGR